MAVLIVTPSPLLALAAGSRKKDPTHCGSNVSRGIWDVRRAREMDHRDMARW